MRLVLVEDNEDLVVMLRAILPRLVDDLEIVAYFSMATEAAKWAGWEDVDVVITDHQMPEMTGADLLAWLSKTYPDVKRIMISAADPSPEARATADVYVDKWDFVEEPERYLT